MFWLYRGSGIELWRGHSIAMVGLIIFQKNAVLGKVKTRIAATAGDHKALEIYHLLTTYTHREARDVKVDKFLFFSDYIPEEASALYPGYQLRVQCQGDLGDRMSDAFSLLFSQGYSSVVIVGTDCPELKASDLNGAFLALTHHDLVIGPARDGGYYLLGTNGYRPELFRDIRWSTSEVLEHTLDRANEAALDYEFLEIYSDVDTMEDWEDFCGSLKDSAG